MDPDVTQSMANLGVVYHASAKYQQARAFSASALKIYKCFHKSDDPDLQTMISNQEALLREINPE